MTVFLVTDRLTLRRFEDGDADAGLLFDLDSDPEVMRYVGPFGLPTRDAYRDLIRTRWLPYYAAHPARGGWVVEERAAGRFVGWVMLRPSTDYRFAREAGWTRPSDLELGYRLRREAWGNGFATEMATALARLGRADPTTTGVVSCALVTNRASTRVMEKIGLVRVREFALPGFDDPAVAYAGANDLPLEPEALRARQ